MNELLFYAIVGSVAAGFISLWVWSITRSKPLRKGERL